MAVNWTKNQQQIIDFNGGNLLVAAGAGSGKTAVLTAHIVKRITDPTDPVDLDTLLVVTFTNAAAAEMKERVRKNLEDMLENDPENENLARQISLIPSSNISTIHSFCLKLIREQFFRLDLDPGFRLGDTGELSLMKADLMEEIFEESYESREPAFLELRDMYSGRESDDKMTKLILDLYEYAQSYPNPDEWLEESLKEDDDTWTEDLYLSLHNTVADLAVQMQGIVDKATADHIPPSQIAVLTEGQGDLTLLSKKTTIEELILGLSEFKFTRKPPLKNQEKIDYADAADSIEAAFEARKTINGSITNLKKRYAGFNREQIKNQQQETYVLRAEMVKLVRLFGERFSEKKRSLGICDFSDLEHMAMGILYKDNEPTHVADSYAMSFTEVLTDEYQDCNLVQEAILEAVSRERFGAEDRFMVGDVKQSIYGFRQARPDLFLGKYKYYSDEADARSRKVELSDNFRSRSGVLGGINMMFSQIMTEKLGGIAYDEKAALRAGGTYPEREDTPDLELMLLDISSDDEASDDDNDNLADTSGYNKFEYEARMVGEKIIEIVNKPYMVYDKNEDCMRPASFKDIVILMRSLSSTQENYTRILKDMGIPVYVENESGYFSSLEVVDVLNFLRVLDNPMQDIPLAGTMKSPFGGFSAEELAEIRLVGKGKGEDESFYACLMAARDGNSKLDKFMTVIESYRRLSRFIPIHELLMRILEETGYRYYVAALPGGKKRLNNLDMLVAKARSYEETSYRGLFHFIRYIDRLKKYAYEGDTPGGSDEEIDAVRIMTIHKSKGLEFPICFISNMNGQFNMTDLNTPVLLDSRYGIATDVRNAKFRYKIRTIKKAAIRQRKLLGLLEEEMRVLYVAMTRAKEVLIMTGADRKMAKKMEGWKEEAKDQTGELSFSTLSGAVCYLDWVVPAFLVAQGEENEDVSFSLKTMKKGDLGSAHAYVSESGEGEYEKLTEKLKSILSWTYPNEELYGVHAAMSVSEIKKAAYENDEIVNIVRYDEEQKDESGDETEEYTNHGKSAANVSSGTGASSGADRGTAYHRALELYSFKDYPLDGGREEKCQFIICEMDRIKQCHLMSEEDTNLVNIKKLGEFFETELAHRMCLADKNGKLFKEKPFMMGVPVSRVYKDINEESRTILVRGIIDAFFEENGELIIVDYKTDRVFGDAGRDELIRRYKTQLKYYKQALEGAMSDRKKMVGHAYLYSFALKKEIEVLL